MNEFEEWSTLRFGTRTAPLSYSSFFYLKVKGRITDLLHYKNKSFVRKEKSKRMLKAIQRLQHECGVCNKQKHINSTKGT